MCVQNVASFYTNPLVKPKQVELESDHGGSVRPRPQFFETETKIVDNSNTIAANTVTYLSSTPSYSSLSEST